MSRFILGLSLVSLSISALAVPYLAVGNYASTTDNLVDLPLLIQSQDQGSTWSFQDIPSLSDYAYSYFTTATCTDSLCIAAGSVRNPDLSSPLLLQSTDGGNNWNHVVFDDSTIKPSFYTSYCKDETCLLMGLDELTGNPALAFTQDGGATWVINDLSNYFTGIVVAMDCVDDYCVAVGTNISQNLLVQSFDGGNTWAQVNVTGLNPGVFMSVDCNSKFCVTAGYQMADRLDLAMPVIAQSSNDKSLWAVRPVNGSEPSGIFYKVSCNEQTCVAAGTSASAHMMLATSTQGSGWSYEHLGSLKMTKGSLMGADCNSQFCAAVGMNHSDKAVVLTNAAGEWYVESNGVGGRLYHVSCDDTLCYAGGQNSNGGPLLMKNTQGSRWSAVSIANVPNKGKIVSGTSTNNLIK